MPNPILATARAYGTAHRYTILAGVVALAMVLAIVAHCAPTPPVPVAAAQQAAYDALRAQDSVARTALADTAHTAVALAAQRHQDARTALAKAHAAQTRADSLKRLLDAKDNGPVTAPDSVRVLVAVVATQDTAIRQYRATIGADSASAAALWGAVRALAADTVVLAQRLALSEKLNRQWASDYRRATTCRVLWMRCPSRAQSLAYGALAGAVAVLVVRR